MFVPGYRLRNGSPLDRPQLVKFARRTYRELYPDQDFAHLPRLIEQYLSAKTPLWWVEAQHDDEGGFPHRRRPLGCLWLGNAVDQIDGDRHAHIFLLYVDPDHRRRGDWLGPCPPCGNLGPPTGRSPTGPTSLRREPKGHSSLRKTGLSHLFPLDGEAPRLAITGSGFQLGRHRLQKAFLPPQFFL